ncbi:MAG: aspartate kinase [Clostridiaceae bacterium]|jgi:aspartate kinase|nr:aspartate kinase [Clostridiaceae bacterium]
MIVAKFGGSSCANSLQFKKVKQIVEADSRRRVVVVSAPGKDGDKSFKITDTLLLCYQLAREQLDTGEIFEEIADRFREIRNGLGLKLDLESRLEEIQDRLSSGASQDYVASRGEYLNALLMADYLGFHFVDASELIRFDDQGKYDQAATYQLLEAFWAQLEDQATGIVVPGFYGADGDGRIVTFPRGGSDITGAILAAGLDASLYENWTDVTGYLVADPKIIQGPETIDCLSYNELRELSYSDSQVIQADAIAATREAGIPIQIKNTNSPQNPGTVIQIEKAPSGRLVTGIAGQKDFTVINLKKYDKNQDDGFLRKICTVFEAHKVTIHHMPTSLDTISVIFRIDDNNELKQILEQLQLYCKPDQSSCETGMALIAVVGEQMAFQPGLAGKVFGALGDQGVNVRMITQGSSEYNIVIGVENRQYRQAVFALHDCFFGQEENNGRA